MGGYIRMDKDLADDPRVDELAEHYVALASIPKPLARNAVMGGLYALWRYGDTHLGRHNRIKGALHGPARISEVTALPALLLEKVPPEWLRFHPDGSVELPDYAAKNNLIDRDMRREKGRERVRRYRERKRKEPAEGNALPSVTGKALQRYKSVTTGTGPGPGPGPEPEPPNRDRDRTDGAALAAGQGAAAPRKSFEEEFRERFHGAEPVKPS